MSQQYLRSLTPIWSSKLTRRTPTSPRALSGSSIGCSMLPLLSSGEDLKLLAKHDNSVTFISDLATPVLRLPLRATSSTTAPTRLAKHQQLELNCLLELKELLLSVVSLVWRS